MSNQLISALEIPLNHDLFLVNLLRELSGTLEDTVGVEDASGFISIVGQNIGDWINGEYRRGFGVEQLDLDQMASTLVDLKRRIGGDFYVISVDREKIVLGNRRCPFGDKVIDRSSLCMMTSNVFGTIAAENLGYAKVTLEETIAAGDDGCVVVIHLARNGSSESVDGREYYKS